MSPFPVNPRWYDEYWMTESGHVCSVWPRRCAACAVQHNYARGRILAPKGGARMIGALAGRPSKLKRPRRFFGLPAWINYARGAGAGCAGGRGAGCTGGRVCTLGWQRPFT
jgi:hypothetical protein